MTAGRLSPLQVRLLALLIEADHDWTLGGGAALAGVYTRHRSTRDLDLFWRRDALGDAAQKIRSHLQDAGLSCNVLQSGTRFTRLRVSEKGESIVLDLIAEPGGIIEEAATAEIEGTLLRVFTAHELLVEKLCALLERSELRDLLDVKVLIGSGGNLERAVHDAPRKDGGFSPLTLAWTLRGLDVSGLAAAASVDPSEAQELAKYRDVLVKQLLDMADPRT